MECDWDPGGPLGWVRHLPGGGWERWTLRNVEALVDGSTQQLLNAFDASALEQLWSDAALHWRGGGLQHGADMASHRAM
eukprot:298039-Pyramimonas_sp.AAC.1